jgi:ABC-2 family transporter protein
MAANNGFFFLLWVLFFAGFRRVGGWQLADVSLLLGLIMTVVGVAGVSCGGYRDMAAAILAGEVGTLLTQPKPVLMRLIARESFAHAFGDIATGLTLLATLSGLDCAHIPLAVVGVAVGLVVYVSAGITFASLAFWSAGARSFARDLTDFILMFSSHDTARRLCRAGTGGSHPRADARPSCDRRGGGDRLCGLRDFCIPPRPQTMPAYRGAVGQLSWSRPQCRAARIEEV